jgi:hypothetical protein
MDFSNRKPPFSRSSKTACSLALLALVLSLAGCGRNHRFEHGSILHDPSSAGKNPSDGETPPDDEPTEDLTPEEIRHRKAEALVLEKNTDTEMSREKMIKLVEEVEKALPLEPLEPKPSPSPVVTPSPGPSTTPSENPTPVLSPSPTPSPSPSPVVTPAPSPSPSPKGPRVNPRAGRRTIWPSARPSPSPSPSPIPSVKPEPKPSSTPVVDDSGVDAEDEKFTQTYSGPKEVIDYPRTTPEYRLSEIAANFGTMRPKSEYLKIQKSLVGNSTKACNLFFAAALIEAKAPDAKGKVATRDNFPGGLATHLDTTYFGPGGWKKITLTELKKAFRDRKSFDVAIQRDAPAGKIHGHVAIPIGLNADGKVMVAEASYLKDSNRIAVYTDDTLSKKFRIYVRD